MQVPQQLRDSWQGLRTSWSGLGDGERQLARALIGIAVFVVLVLALFGNPFPRSLTYGEIWVDSPEIYTRERLVNDRFIQDAWLSQQLSRSKDAHDAVQLLGSRTQASLLPAGVPAVGSTPAAASDAAPHLSSRDRFLGELDFRELIRNLAIENQLDDRHDMHGHSLYRLKFDASVAPGDNTQATAIIEVTLRAAPSIPVVTKKRAGTEPLPGLGDIGSDTEVKKWRMVYRRWLDNLGYRLNETQAEQKQAYDKEEVTHNEYVDYIHYLEQTLFLTASGLKCGAEVSTPSLDSALRPMTREEHAAHRDCLQAFYLAASINEGADPTAMKHSADDYLNSFLAPKTLQLVLGIPSQTNLILNNDLRKWRSLDPLSSLSLLSVQTSDPYGSNVFYVQARQPRISAIDPKRVNEAAWLKAVEKIPYLLSDFSDFRAYPQISKKLLVSKPDLDDIHDDNYSFGDGDFIELEDAPGVYVAAPETGLLNFARRAGSNPPAFTYAVTPKESGDAVDASLGAGSRIDSGGLFKGAGTTLALEREQTARALQRRNNVVGFGENSQDKEMKARFGWIIGPRVPAIDGQRLTYVQGAGQYALSALVSMPSWWDEVEMQVRTTWRNTDGSSRSSEGKSYIMRIPTDFEPLEAALLQIEQRKPTVLESRLDAIALTACQPGAIVIPGRRLWRSTKVSLGYQVADEIAVLPDMKGIVATFRTVQNQASLDEQRAGDDVRRPVRVWTSQGSTSLPYPARIGIRGIPKSCDAAVAAAPAASN